MTYLVTGSSDVRLLLAHGAGAPMDSEFMNELADALADNRVQTIRFEFPYMQLRRADGRKRPPNREPVLLDAWRESVSAVLEGRVTGVADGGRVFIGGKSMGGRMASLLAATQEAPGHGIAGCLCFGYPFHAPGKPSHWRTSHFADLQVPLWIAQGDRDPFGGYGQALDRLQGTRALSLVRVEDGDHDFRPRKRSGLTRAELIAKVACQAADFMRRGI